MRYLALGLLVAAVLLAALMVARDSRPAGGQTLRMPFVAGASRPPPITGARSIAHAGPTFGTNAPPPLHELLAERARNGDSGAALELARLLEACAERSETAGMMAILSQDWGPAPTCADRGECEAQDHAFDAFVDSFSRSRASDRTCKNVPRDWIARRGRWLERAAELGDSEARACYALVGVELAPQAYDASSALWLEQWRRQALPWAWDAWRRGEPRAALALARLYAPGATVAGDVRLVEPEPARAYRFALLLARLVDLDQGADDLAQLTSRAAEWLSPRELAEGEFWVQSELARVARGTGRASRTPNRCWQHFAVFEPPIDGVYAAAR